MFYFEEIFKSTSKEDADLFYCEDFRSISREDADLFYCEEKFRSTSREDANLFFFFFLRKRVIHMQIIDIQESDYNNYIKKIML